MLKRGADSIYTALSNICYQARIDLCSVVYLAVLYQCVHGYCSTELANCMPPSSHGLYAQTFLFTFSSYSVHLSNVKVNYYLHFFIPSTRKLWSTTVLICYPPFFDVPL